MLVAATGTAVALLPPVSPEGYTWGKEKQTSGFEDGSKLTCAVSVGFVCSFGILKTFSESL